MHWYLIYLLSVFAWMAKLGNTGTSILVKGCAPGGKSVCNVTLLFLLNDSVWSGAFFLPYTIEAGDAPDAAPVWLSRHPLGS
jgi:hypothetical protein